MKKTDSTTVIPCTEASAGRSGKRPANHPLCDKLQYIAADFVDFGGEVTSGYAGSPREPQQNYLRDLSAWSESEHGHPKVRAICSYVKSGRVIRDLVEAALLPVRPDGKFLKAWPKGKSDPPAVFRLMATEQCPEDAFVRWRVEGTDLASETWRDVSLFQSWIAYYESMESVQGLCMATGQPASLATSHPSKLRHAGDKAKLISSNDSR